MAAAPSAAARMKNALQMKRDLWDSRYFTHIAGQDPQPGRWDTDSDQLPEFQFLSGLTWIHCPQTNIIVLETIARKIRIVQSASDVLPDPDVGRCFLGFFSQNSANDSAFPRDKDLCYREYMYEPKDVPLDDGRTLRKTAIVFPFLWLESEANWEYKRNAYRALRRSLKADCDAVHIERTLDEAYYPGLPAKSLAERNKKQVVTREVRRADSTKYKHSKYGVLGPRAPMSLEPILVVPQLWIWRFGNVILSACTCPMDKSTCTLLQSPMRKVPLASHEPRHSQERSLDVKIMKASEPSETTKDLATESEDAKSPGLLDMSKKRAPDSAQEPEHSPTPIASGPESGIAKSPVPLGIAQKSPLKPAHAAFPELQIAAIVANHVELFGQRRWDFSSSLDYFELGLNRILSDVESYVRKQSYDSLRLTEEASFLLDIADIRAELVMIQVFLDQQQEVLNLVFADVDRRAREVATDKEAATRSLTDERANYERAGRDRDDLEREALSKKEYRENHNLSEEERALSIVQEADLEREALHKTVLEQDLIRKVADKVSILESAEEVYNDFIAITNGAEWSKVAYSQRTLARYIKRTSKIDKDADLVEKTIRDQLELKRAYASLRDARASLVVAVAVIGFTVVTLIFTPLSFITGLYQLPLESLARGGLVAMGEQMVWRDGNVGKWFTVTEIVTLTVTILASVSIWLLFLKIHDGADGRTASGHTDGMTEAVDLTDASTNSSGNENGLRMAASTVRYALRWRNKMRGEDYD